MVKDIMKNLNSRASHQDKETVEQDNTNYTLVTVDMMYREQDFIP